MVKYFLGANTANGFYSLFDELYFPEYDGRLFIIKGGPGTGKSSVMKRIATEAENRGYKTERIYCSSDPSSLDGVIIPEIKTSVADGTSPHVIEPKYPGAVEQIVNFGDCWDRGFLRSKTESIIEKSFECSSYHKRCVRFLKAYSALLNDSLRLVEPHIESEKLSDFTERLCLREFENRSGKGESRVSFRFLSAVTPKGITFFEETLKNKCDRVITIEDEYGVVSDRILRAVLKRAVKAGFDVTVCPCVTNPKKKIDHLIIPEKRLCFVTENSAHLLSEKGEKSILSKRFMNASEIKKHSARLSFNRRASLELLDEAVMSLVNAKSIHDELEKFYIDAMDFDLLNEKAQKLINEIFD